MSLQFHLPRIYSPRSQFCNSPVSWAYAHFANHCFSLVCGRSLPAGFTRLRALHPAGTCWPAGLTACGPSFLPAGPHLNCVLQSHKALRADICAASAQSHLLYSQTENNCIHALPSCYMHAYATICTFYFNQIIIQLILIESHCIQLNVPALCLPHPRFPNAVTSPAPLYVQQPVIVLFVLSLPPSAHGAQISSILRSHPFALALPSQEVHPPLLLPLPIRITSSVPLTLMKMDIYWPM